MPEGNTARCLYKGFGVHLGVPDKVRFAPDSPLEGSGFELFVPPRLAEMGTFSLPIDVWL